MLFLLHGALYEAGEFGSLAGAIEDRYPVHRFTFPGHGSEAFPEEEFSISLFGEATLAEMQRLGLESISIFGYSMGGYVGLWLARHHPERVKRVMTLATKMDWTPEGATREIKMLDPDTIEEKVPDFGATLRKRHGDERWRGVLQRTATMMTNLGAAPELSDTDLQAIDRPVRMIVGDRDRMVTIEETVETYRKIQQGELAVLPRTGHPLELVDISLVEQQIDHFFPS